MKTKVTGAKFRFALGRVGQLFRRVVWLGAVILICSCASAQKMAGLYKPRDMAFDRAGNLFFVDYEIVGGDLRGNGIESAIASSGFAEGWRSL
jgi:hypothetical protein